MKKTIVISLLLLAAAILMPMLAVSPADTAATPLPAPAAEETSGPPKEKAAGQADSEIRFTALLDGVPFETTMAEYLPGSIAGEMPASFEPEALKAQAVAARTYILYRIAHPHTRHPEAAVCGDPSCCKAFVAEETLRENWGEAFEDNRQKMADAVKGTDGRYLTYAGEPIQAVFHSSSSARTEESGNIWQELPYLVSVESPENAGDVPNFISTVEVSAEEFKSTILMLHPDAEFEGVPLSWLGEIKCYESGRVENVRAGGIIIPGNEIRGMFSLRSTAFSLDCTGESFLFTVRGYGHGVGMSQYGANAMAKSGESFEDILRHYYPGTELSG